MEVAEEASEDRQPDAPAGASATTIEPPLFHALKPTSAPPRLLATSLTRQQTRLSARDHTLLQTKQRLLRQEAVDRHNGPSDGRARPVVDATLVFAQQAAGTAVCISSNGLLLTCSHCVAESAEELEGELSGNGGNVLRWLLFSSGRVVAAELVPGTWDQTRDLALLRILRAQAPPQSPDTGIETFQYPCVPIAADPPKISERLLCVGHPSSEDLEASEAGRQTGYDVLHTSRGRFRGCNPGQDLQNNSEIGALKHDCWTYWGHSGAPLVVEKNGRLVGLHSSWDDETAMRRGVPLQAIESFLRLHTAVVIDD